jgi:hypothetical protein
MRLVAVSSATAMGAAVALLCCRASGSGSARAPRRAARSSSHFAPGMRFVQFSRMHFWRHIGRGLCR